MSTEKEKELRKFVYMGQCEKGHKYGLIELDNNQRVERIWTLSKPIYKSIVGSIFEFEFLDNTISYNLKQRAINYWEDSKHISEWKLEERAFKYSKKEIDTVKNKSLETELKWLNDIYKSSSYTERTIILAEIIRLITK